MAEELRIVVKDEGGGATGSAGQPTAPAGGAVQQGQQTTQPAPPPVQKPPEPKEKASAFTESNVTAVLSRMEGIVAKVASGDVGGAASGAAGAAGAMAKAMAKGGPIAAAVAGFVATMGAAALAAKAFANMVESQVTKLAGYSGEVAIAEAETQLRREFAMMRRAERIGPDLASAERMRSRFESRLADVQTELLKVVLRIAEQFGPAIEGALVVLEAMAEWVEKIGDVIIKLWPLMRAIAPAFGLAGPAIIRFLEEIAANTRRDDEEDDPGFVDWAVEQFMGHVPNSPQFWPEDQPLPRGRGAAVPEGV